MPKKLKRDRGNRQSIRVLRIPVDHIYVCTTLYSNTWLITYNRQIQTFSFNPGNSVSKYSNFPDFIKISLLRQWSAKLYNVEHKSNQIRKPKIEITKQIQKKKKKLQSGDQHRLTHHLYAITWYNTKFFQFTIYASHGDYHLHYFCTGQTRRENFWN